MADELIVSLHGQAVGRLLRSGDNDQIEFRADEAWIQQLNAPVLGQYFLDQPEQRLKSRVRVPAWFSNLLPEGVLREFLARRAGVNPAREFFLLAELGGDLPGAVEVHANGSVRPEADPLAEALPAKVSPDEPMKFSLAGLQLKFSAVVDGDRFRLPARGQGGRWLLKLPDWRFPQVPRNEYAVMTWARHLGLETAAVRLVSVKEIDGLPEEIQPGEPDALAVERFDRLADSRQRIHTEDFLQVLNEYPGDATKYSAANVESLASIVAALADVAGLREVVGRLLFNTLTGNGDAHLKNWSLRYENPTAARLSPAYDLVSTVQYLFNDGQALNLSKNKRWEHLELGHFDRLAERLSRRGVCVESATVRTWLAEFAERARAELPVLRDLVPTEFMETLRRHWARTPFLAQVGFVPSSGE